ncbi:VOC family protein [Bacillus timonensis]|nr:VOC family protein [Bacillus timonensis]
MSSFVTRIATIELPVSDLETAANWYAKHLNMIVQHKSENEAMLSFNAKGVPTLFLVRTEDEKRMDFTNSRNGVTHSVVDFYTYDLKGFHEYLRESGVEVGKLNMMNEKFGGFGFKDPDGNSLSATNVQHLGQE